MIPLGTGLFKTVYDTSKHNETLTGQRTIRPNLNIVEDRLKKSNSDIGNALSFNLIDLIK